MSVKQQDNDHRLLLGGLSSREFMTRHWQKKWRLMRAAVPDFDELIDAKALFSLAASDEVESRLVLRDGKTWSLEQGPFSKKRLAGLPARDWTLLVQGLNLHLPAADALLRRFSFLPYARLDDVMISLAAPGGGVGPHFDSYDVFLLQGVGRRRWKVSEQTDLELVPDAPLKILKRMQANESFDLAAGDMLYLPPQVAHEGVATQTEGYCTTYSIGFRAPTHQEIADNFLDWIGATSELDGRLNDPDLMPTQYPARVPTIYQREIVAAIEKLQMNRNAIRQFAGCFATDVKPHIVFGPPSMPITRKAFARAAADPVAGGVAFAAATLCLYDDEFLFINGEAFVIQGDVAFWRALADARRARISAVQLGETIDALYDWYCHGWLQLVAHTKP